MFLIGSNQGDGDQNNIDRRKEGIGPSGCTMIASLDSPGLGGCRGVRGRESDPYILSEPVLMREQGAQSSAGELQQTSSPAFSCYFLACDEQLRLQGISLLTDTMDSVSRCARLQRASRSARLYPAERRSLGIHL
ncbi:unnamed protein product [Arctogadus glacialis]